MGWLLVAAACGNGSGPDPDRLLGEWEYRAGYDADVVEGTIEIQQHADTSFGGTFNLTASSSELVPLDTTAPVAGWVESNGLVHMQIQASGAVVKHLGGHDAGTMLGRCWAAVTGQSDSIPCAYTMWWRVAQP